MSSQCSYWSNNPIWLPLAYSRHENAYWAAFSSTSIFVPAEYAQNDIFSISKKFCRTDFGEGTLQVINLDFYMKIEMGKWIEGGLVLSFCVCCPFDWEFYFGLDEYGLSLSFWEFFKLYFHCLFCDCDCLNTYIEIHIRDFANWVSVIFSNY